jgi:hypothetical protein
MAHAVISGGVAVFALAKSQTDALAYSVMKEGTPIPGYKPEVEETVKGLYLGTGAFGHGQTGGGFMSLTDGRFVTDTGGAFVGTRAMNGY